MNWYIIVIWVLSVVVFSTLSAFIGRVIGYARGRKDADKAMVKKGLGKEKISVK
jgi:hypothetical protein